MSPILVAVHRKALAFVESLSRLPRSARASVPYGHFARDYNTLRRLAEDKSLRTRFLQGATIDELVSEFGRNSGGIRARLRKLGLDHLDEISRLTGESSDAEPPSSPTDLKKNEHPDTA
jgi:hypothetical protein